MSQLEKVNELKIEIQKLLGEIHRDMTKLKTEVASLHDILDVDASLPTNQKLVNDRLMLAAKEAGIDLNDLEIETSREGLEQDASQHDSSQEHDSERANGTQESQEGNEQTFSASNAASLAAATDKLTKTVKRTLRKVD